MVEKFGIFYDILCGSKALHSNGIVYADMKPENILIQVTEEDHNVRLQAKSADFGLSLSNRNGLGYPNAATGYGFGICSQLDEGQLVYSSEGTRPILIPRHVRQDMQRDMKPTNGKSVYYNEPSSHSA